MITRSFLVRGSQLALLGILIAVTAGATDSSARFDKDSHEIDVRLRLQSAAGRMQPCRLSGFAGDARSNCRQLLPGAIATTASFISSRSNMGR